MLYSTWPMGTTAVECLAARLQITSPDVREAALVLVEQRQFRVDERICYTCGRINEAVAFVNENDGSPGAVVTRREPNERERTQDVGLRLAVELSVQQARRACRAALIAVLRAQRAVASAREAVSESVARRRRSR
jgi:hypothetical protein